MKRVIIIFAAICLSFAGFEAQAQKFGHINSADLLQVMPEWQKVQTALATEQQTAMTRFQALQQEYQNKYAELQRQEAQLSDLIKQDAIQDLQSLEDRIRKFEQDAQESLMKKQAELLAPVEKAAMDAINAVASEKGYTYVFDSSGTVLLVTPDSDDLLPAVKAKLGITI